ncbi:metalloregulator ArsR/SmtB family transcription factor [Aureimonas fodinaquatilis]|uniref:Metalloregulator ArsR/SmtB family transcription factor n=1 Tax=Aureimonas fodinaquatilis TaxID=2565783 RepID=A0A5B0E0H8_9HYPH|nr:metalloregulator ArsR/SmtB family transcription factor [Aureimonas fodinaquatilis]KAA0972567.1 metalloregulator ArsR/SmtB family transcription factor [Aureimonas fodinaquatilis]
MLPFTECVDLLKAVGEPTRLRLVLLLSQGDLTVSDMVTILGQSQPRISRHLKLLSEARVISRYQEGAWAYFRLDDGAAAGLVQCILPTLDLLDPMLTRDAERLELVRRERAERAADYFASNAAQWDRIRSMHVPDAETEKALQAVLGDEPYGALLDVGTGTGRMLELLAPASARALGIDASREMLAIARAKLDSSNYSHVTVRQGSAYHLPADGGKFDLITLHQVLHYLDDPANAIREAASVLSPGGRLVIVDFAPHDCEFLRTDHAHLRLGFSDETLNGYFEGAGLALEAGQTLPPAGKTGEELTVLIALARKPANALPGEHLRSAQLA